MVRCLIQPSKTTVNLCNVYSTSAIQLLLRQFQQEHLVSSPLRVFFSVLSDLHTGILIFRYSAFVYQVMQAYSSPAVSPCNKASIGKFCVRTGKSETYCCFWFILIKANLGKLAVYDHWWKVNEPDWPV